MESHYKPQWWQYVIALTVIYIYIQAEMSLASQTLPGMWLLESNRDDSAEELWAEWKVSENASFKQFCVQIYETKL